MIPALGSNYNVQFYSFPCANAQEVGFSFKGSSKVFKQTADALIGLNYGNGTCAGSINGVDIRDPITGSKISILGGEPSVGRALSFAELTLQPRSPLLEVVLLDLQPRWPEWTYHLLRYRGLKAVQLELGLGLSQPALDYPSHFDTYLHPASRKSVFYRFLSMHCNLLRFP